MNTENLKKLQDQLFRKGFGNSLNETLEQEMKSGKPEFVLEHITQHDNNEADYRLHFKRDDDPQKDQVYFNSFDTGLFKIEGAPGEIREHNFRADQLITANEAYRMLLYGDLAAVNKNLFNKDGDKYNTWLSIDIRGDKDQYGNYPVNSYHQNYYKNEPFIVMDELMKLKTPIKMLATHNGRDVAEKKLKKAHVIQTKIKVNGEEIDGLLTINPKESSADLYNDKMELVESSRQEQGLQTTQQQTTNATPEQEQGDVKKNETTQRMSWAQSPRNRKGQGI